MNFLDSIKRQEKEKQRIATWSRVVTELSRFVRHHLRQAEAQSPLTVRSDLIRIDRTLFTRLTLLLNGQTLTITPLSLADARTPEGGGCVAVRSTNGTHCNFLWNGDSPATPGDWTIAAADDSIAGEGARAPEPLSEASLDDALNRLFGFSGRAEPRADERSGGARPARPAGAIPFAATANFYSGVRNPNGRARSMLDAKEINSFAPAYRKP